MENVHRNKQKRRGRCRFPWEGSVAKDRWPKERMKRQVKSRMQFSILHGAKPNVLVYIKVGGNKCLCSTWLGFNLEVPEKCKVHTLALESVAVHTF